MENTSFHKFIGMRSRRAKVAKILLKLHKIYPDENIPVLVEGMVPLEKGPVKKILSEILEDV